MKELKRVLALVLCAVMLVGVLPVGALGADVETAASSEPLVIQAEEAAVAAVGIPEADDIETPAPVVEEEPSADDVVEEEPSADEVVEEEPSDEEVVEEEPSDEEIVEEEPSDEEIVEEEPSDEEIVEEEPSDEEIVEEEPSAEETEAVEPSEEAIVTEEETADAEDAAARVEGNQVIVDPVIDRKYESTTVTVYKLDTTPDLDKQYLIVNSNSTNTSSYYGRYGLDGDTSGYSLSLVTDKTGYYVEWDSESNTGTEYTFVDNTPYLTTSSPYLWKVEASGDDFMLTHDTVKLGMNNNNLVFSSDASNTTWRYSDSVLYNTTRQRYLRCSADWDGNHNWSTDSSDWWADVYFYEPVELTKVTVTETVLVQGGTYTLSGSEITIALPSSKAPLSSLMDWTGSDDEAADDWVITYDVVADEAGIFSQTDGKYDISEFDPDFEEASIGLSGKEGTATVKVTYTSAELGVSVSAEIIITTYAPTPVIEIVEVDDIEPIDYVIVIKGEEKMKKDYPLDYYLFAKEDGADMMDLVGTASWTTDKAEIATMVQTTDEEGNVVHNVHFEGGEGAVNVTVTYTYIGTDGKEYSVSDTVTFSVSKSDYFIPSDGTNDFPEYPNEGAVRIDKTATAVGDFSTTGVAQVELSMAGVPYDNGKPVDVIIMVDMSTSMNKATNGIADRVTPAKNATINAIKKLVQKENGEFNDNRVAVYSFAGDVNPGSNQSCSLQKFDATLLQTVIGTADANGNYSGGYIGGWETASATGYYEALSHCETIFANAKKADPNYNREQVLIFVTDGAPSTHFYYVDKDGNRQDAGDAGSGNESDVASRNLDEYTEWYSYQMKMAGVEIYSIGIQLTEKDHPTGRAILRNIAGTSVEVDDTVVVVDADVGGYEKYAQFVGNDVNTLDTLFQNIVGEILEAATDIEVHDVVADEYKLILDNPGTLTEDEAKKLKIEVVEYTLDANKNRVGDPTVIETIAAGSDKVSYDADGKLVIDADNFEYNEATQTLKWSADKVDVTELAIRYYVYLDGAKENSVAAGTYPTNEYAYITYTNHLNHLCQKYFPVPQLTWQGAQVTYRFYLVNDAGQPINRSGKVVPFNEAVWVTEDVTKAVTWGAQDMLAADLLAIGSVPDVYELYDSNAYYEIRVYQKEGGKNYNYFIIEGSGKDTLNAANPNRPDNTDASLNSTKVFNTLTGTRYDSYGAYASTNKMEDGSDFKPVSHNPNSVTTEGYTPTVTKNFDYAATTVAFAVKWSQKLAEDTVVIDYGLDVVIDVLDNDELEGKVVGVLAEENEPSVDINSGVYNDLVRESKADVKIGDTIVGEASLVPGNTQAVRFSLNKDTSWDEENKECKLATGMMFTEPVTFFYEAEIKYLKDGVTQTEGRYSSVTIIPATTIYYEDEYVTMKTFTKDVNDVDQDGDTEEYIETPGWEVPSEAASATQAVDRPGLNPGMGETYDANNVYGYDEAYKNCSTYSMDKAAMINVKSGKYGTAEFEFYGTGFELFSITSNKTGTLAVKVEDVSNPANPVTIKTGGVDTYYGYDYDWYKVYYIRTSGGWVQATNAQSPGGVSVTGPVTVPDDYDEDAALEEALKVTDEDVLGSTRQVTQMYWKQVNNTDNAMYQVPVIKLTDLTYKHYKVTLTATYISVFDHTADDGYDLYLDAIRIYDPTGVVSGVENETVSKAYMADGEGWARYQEVRNIILENDIFKTVDESGNLVENVEGAIFIDQKGGSYTMADYRAYGPNNEMYLAKDQAIAFILNPTVYKAAVADVQIGLKSANGKEVLAEMSTYTQKTDGTLEAKTSTAKILDSSKSATDRYYSIGSHVNKDAPTIVSFKNTSTGVLSITNVKFTFDAAPTATADVSEGFYMTKSAANGILLAMNKVEEEETVVPEESIPEDITPEETVPEVTEPEPDLDADLEVSISKTKVKEGSTVTVKAITSSDVASLRVNGEEITEYKQNKKTGKRTWTVKVKAEEAGEMEIEVEACSARGTVLDTMIETIEVTAKKSGNVNKIIGELLGKLFG